MVFFCESTYPQQYVLTFVFNNIKYGYGNLERTEVTFPQILWLGLHNYAKKLFFCS